jgi:hypothetical protein
LENLILRYRISLVLLALVVSAFGGNSRQANAARPAPRPNPDSKKRFVLDVVRSAVALPQPDPQDRLRVLNSAASVVGPFAPAMARSFAREGAQIEAEMIAHGEKPAVSLLAAGNADCATAARFVETIAPASVQAAEQSLLGALGACPKQVLEPIRQKVEAALSSGTLAARPLLAVIEAVGPSSRWSQTQFAQMFSSLPNDANRARAEAPNFSAMYVRIAPVIDKDVTRDTGLRFLTWLGKLDESGERNLSVNMTTEAMKQALGEEAYQEALRSDVVAQGVANTAGRPGELEHPEEESVSVLQAMGQSGVDKTKEISELAPSLRAREAAAHGFASGTDGNRKLADRYFDIAFSAVDEVWSRRSRQANASALVEEVSEAAAQVDAVAALKRAQQLGDPSAQAISMLAVARVVAGQQ